MKKEYSAMEEKKRRGRPAKPEKDRRITFNFSLYPWQVAKLKQEAFRRGVPVSKVVSDLVDQYLPQPNQKQDDTS